MRKECVLSLVVCLIGVHLLGGVEASAQTAPGWRAAESAPAPPPAAETPRRDSESAAPFRLTQHSSVASGPVSQHSPIPIGSYTQAVQSTRRPQQAIIDWILRETGYEVWHGDCHGASLTATESEVRVTHTAEMHRVVKGIVERFTNTDALKRGFGVRVVTVDEPDWRARAYRSMRSVPTNSPGVSAWLLDRDQAATLLSDLGKRSDYREPPENNVQPQIENGQSFVLSSTRSVSYLRDVSAQRGPSGPQPIPDQLSEGLSLELSPLVSADNRSIDAVLKCHIDQVEALRPVMLDVPAGLGSNQSVRTDVPQISQYRLQERFRWPTDQVLVVSLGLAPSPHRSVPVLANLRSLTSFNFGEQVPGRCEVLVFVECKGQNSVATVRQGPGGTPRQVRTNYHHRY